MSNDYDTIKAKIISMYSRSDPQILNEFLTVPSTLDCKPSLYLQRLRASTSTWNLPEEFLKTYFLNAMPSTIRNNLITNSGTLNDIAQLADNLIEYSNQPINAYCNPIQANYEHTYHSAPQLGQTRSRYSSSMNNSFDNRNYQNHNWYGNPNRNHSNGSKQFTNYSSSDIPANVRSFNHKQLPKICRFHLYYGEAAKRCKPWCILNSPSVTTMPNSRPSSRGASPSRDNHSASSN